MELYEAMSTLRAVRRLKPDPVPADVLERVMQAAAWAPTGGNVQPFRVIAVSDRQIMAVIGRLYDEEWAKYTRVMREAADAGKLPDDRVRMMKAGDYLAKNMIDVPVMLVWCFNPGNMAITDADLGRPSIVGGGSVYTAVQNTMLACVEEGLGCVLTTLLCYREDEIRELLDIPTDWYTCAHVPIGYPVLRGHGPISRRPVEKLFYADRFGKPYA